LIVEALEILQGIARNARTTWHGQWDGRFVMIVQAKDGADVEARVIKVGPVTRYRCGAKDVIVLHPDVSPLNAHVTDVLRELRLLAMVDGTGVVVVGPKHVLESASARLSMRGVRARIHGRELRVVRP
jgi:hypothetical protein